MKTARVLLFPRGGRGRSCRDASPSIAAGAAHGRADGFGSGAELQSEATLAGVGFVLEPLIRLG